jgi:AAA15 family ATPase/GTPase
MLIEFAVTNFRSFRDRQVFSLLPSGKIRERQIMPLQSKLYPKLQALPTAVLYGPNNSGKSNFLLAVRALDWLVTNSGTFNTGKKLDANEYFEFDIRSKNQETIFEIDFIAPNQRRYNYLVSFNKSEILREELYVYNVSETGKITVKTLYEREKQSIKFPALKGKRESITFKENQLFLSRGDIAENEELVEVYSFFSTNFYIYLFTENEYTNFLIKKYAEFVAENKDNDMPKLIESILRETDTGILGVETNLVDTSKIKFPENTPQYLIDKIFEELKYEIRTRHKLFSGEKEIGEESLSLNEQSTGTIKLLGLIPLMLSALKDGDTIFIDEMNTSLHTEITTLLIDLFNNKETNPNNAQLIITTHDYTLLHKELYDKDQIFVVDKNKYGASDMYSFADITGLLKKNSLSEYYETGRLGGVPHIAKPYLQNVISQFLKDAKTEISEA